MPAFVSSILCFLTNYTLELATVVMALATGCVAYGIFQQTKAMRTQNDITKRQISISEKLADLEKDKQENKIRIGLTSSDDREGFSVINIGQTEVVITGFWLDPGVREDDSALGIQIGAPRREYDGIKGLPHRLKPGDRFSVTFDRKHLIDQMNNYFDSNSHRILPICQDSLGTTYSLKWIEWHPGGGITARDSPMPGYKPSATWGEHKYYPPT